MDNMTNCLTAARNILKEIHADKENADSFYPVTVNDSEFFTVLVAPDTSATDKRPLVITIPNGVLVNLYGYAVRMNDGDEGICDLDFLIDSYNFDDEITDCFALLFFDHTTIVNGLTLINPELSKAAGASSSDDFCIPMVR